MSPHIKRLLDEAQHACHMLNSTDNKRNGFDEATYYRAAQALQKAIDAANKAEGLNEFGEVSARHTALQQSESDYNNLTRDERAEMQQREFETTP